MSEPSERTSHTTAARGYRQGARRVRTLGGISVDGTPFAHRKPLVLLAYLALEGPQRRAHVARLFWPRSRDARNRLSVTLSRLRAALPDAVIADAESVATRLGSDVAVLRRLLERDRIEFAVRVYRGPFLAGADDVDAGEELTEWMHATRDALSYGLQVACLRAGARAAAAGRFFDGAARVEVGRRVAGAAALDADDMRLAHTLLKAGGSPMSEVLARDAATLGIALTADRAGARATLRSAPAAEVPHNLRVPATSFVGRDAERTHVNELLERDDRRIVTLVGPGGIGKSRLAIEVASAQLDRRRFVGGVYFVPFEHVEEPSRVVAAIVDVIASVRPAAGSPGGDPLQRARAALRHGRTLLVLDNLEHLIDGAPRLAELVSTCPNTTLLVTSSVPLDLSEEWMVPLDGLAYPEPSAAPSASGAWPALQLFEDRGRQVDPAFALGDEDASRIATIAERTGGSPLALELAAAWVGTLPVADIAAEFAHDRDFLASTQRDRVDRHRSLRAVFEHSWRLLAPGERNGLAALAVFRGTFDRAAAAFVADVDAMCLAALTARALVARVSDDDYARHPLLHQYADEKLEDLGATADAVRARHAAHFCAVAEAAATQRRTSAHFARLDHLEPHHADLRSALAWADRTGDAQLLLRLTDALVEFWLWRGHHAEAMHWFARVADRGPTATDVRPYAHRLLDFAFVCLGQQEFATPTRLIADARALFEAAEDVAGMARAQAHLGMLAVFQGDYLAARGPYLEALALARTAGDRNGEARALNNLGDAHAYAGEPEAALTYYRDALAMLRDGHDHQMTSNVLGALGLAALDAGEPSHARRAIGESIDLLGKLDIPMSVPVALDQLGCLASAADRGELAARFWGAAAALRAALPLPVPVFAALQEAPYRRRARERAGDEAFERAWQEGLRLPRERATALAWSDAARALVADEGAPAGS